MVRMMDTCIIEAMNTKILRNLDALLITNPTNIRYLTGFVGAAPEEREAYCLITQEQIFLFTNALYLEQSRNLKPQISMTKQDTMMVVEISREKSLSKELAKLTSDLSIKKLGFEETDLTVAEYHKIKHVLKNVRLVPTKGRVEELRMIKRDDEIENIRHAAKLTDQCFDFILGKLRPGVTEGEVAWAIESFIRTRGASFAFSPIVAFRKNSSMPHYAQCQMSNAKCQMNDIVLMDFGSRVNGYCSDMTRVVFVGKPKNEWIKTYETVHEAQRKALEYLTQQRSGATADRIAQDVIKKAGYPVYPHSLGHGVGLDIHEAPRLTVKKDTILKPNMVITIEPAIYIEGTYGIRIEDLVLLKSNGIEILSQSPKDIQI